jgi:hypothetical protein
LDSFTLENDFYKKAFPVLGQSKGDLARCSVQKYESTFGVQYPGQVQQMLDLCLDHNPHIRYDDLYEKFTHPGALEMLYHRRIGLHGKTVSC